MLQSLNSLTTQPSAARRTKNGLAKAISRPAQQPLSAATMATNGAVAKPRAGAKRPGTELDRNTNGASSAGYEAQQDAIQPVPLKYVVQEAVKRWFEDTMIEAQRGDIKQQALLGQMYNEGYGVTRDTRAAKEWSDKASARGCRMQGVYCEL